MHDPDELPFGQEMHDRWARKVSPSEDGCWLWQASLNSRGYGLISAGGKLMLAHRYAYLAYTGELDNSLQIDHRCMNKACVNPDHLAQVTSRENNRRSGNVSGENARRINCKHGHPLHGDNLIIRSDGKRACRACKKRTSRESYLRKKEAA